MDDLRAVLDAAGVERALLSAGADGGPLALPVRGHVPRTDTRARADATRAAHRVGARLPLGPRRDEFERDLAAMEAGWGTPEYAEEHAHWPMEGMTREEAVEWWLE